MPRHCSIFEAKVLALMHPLWKYSIYVCPGSIDLKLLYTTSTCHMSHIVNYCRTPAQVHAAINPYYDGHLGFDLEWKPNYIAGQPQNPVALVQLATDRNIFLIQIARMRPCMSNPRSAPSHRSPVFRLSSMSGGHLGQPTDPQSRCRDSS
jgi:hypothetical protein